jgi:hypothetical protein
MRHFISLGIRGVLLEFGGLLMRVQGGISYRLRVRRIPHRTGASTRPAA